MADKHGKQDTVTVEELISKVEFLDELKRSHQELKPPADPDPYVIRG